MVRKVLCPVDGSEHASVGVVKAVELARLYNAALALCVVNVTVGGTRGPIISMWEEPEVTAILSRAEAEARAAGATELETAVLKSSEVGPAIVSHAEAIGADHIVMGTGDKRGLKRLVLGSVAADVAGRAECSVTVAR